MKTTAYTVPSQKHNWREGKKKYLPITVKAFLLFLFNIFPVTIKASYLTIALL